jgi:SAM-dependent methyltransferase
VVQVQRPFGWEQYKYEHNPIARLGVYTLGEPHYGIRVRSHYLRFALSEQPLREGAHILDAGCGYGQTTFWLSRHYPDSHILSVDINPRLVHRSQVLADRLQVRNVAYAVADLTKFHSETRFDLIVCTDVLEHIEDWSAAIHNLVGMLNSNGVLIAHVPHSGHFLEADFGFRRFAANDQEQRANHTGRESGSFHVREGFRSTDFDVLSRMGVEYELSYTFGNLGMWAHTLFERYRSSRRYWHFSITPLLSAIARQEVGQSLQDGGGLLLRIRKL